VRKVDYRPFEHIGASFSRRPGAAESFSRASVLPVPDFSVIGGWIAEHTLAERDTTQIVRVHHQEDPERRPFVVKILRPVGDERGESERLRARLLREVIALRALDEAGCPNIPHVVTLGIQSGDRPRFWYVMPYYPGGALWSDDERAPRTAEAYRGDIDRVMEIAQSLASTLAFMHGERRRCIHGDISAENVLLTAPGGLPVLADFGNARLEGYMPDSNAESPESPRRWRAPELGHAGAEPTRASDMYMLGGLIYEAISGGGVLPSARGLRLSPLHEPSEYSLYRYTSDARVAAVEALLARLLAPNPRLRLSAAQVARACHAIRTGRSIGGRTLTDAFAARGIVRRPATGR
jgi:serine/threonine protein kinase